MLAFKRKTKPIKTVLKAGVNNCLPPISYCFNDLKVWHRDQECIQCPYLLNRPLIKQQRDQVLKKTNAASLEESTPLLKSLAMLRKE